MLVDGETGMIGSVGGEIRLSLQLYQLRPRWVLAWRETPRDVPEMVCDQR
jgi:hypothetical protein